MGGSLASFLLFLFIFIPSIRSRSQPDYSCTTDEACLFVKLVNNDNFVLVPIESSNLILNKKHIRFLVEPLSDNEWTISIVTNFNTEIKMTFAEKLVFTISSEGATMSPENGKIETVTVSRSGNEYLATFSLKSDKSLRSKYQVKKFYIDGRKNNNDNDERIRILDGFWKRIHELIHKRQCDISLVHDLCDNNNCIRAVITPSRVDCGDTGAQLQIRSIDKNITLIDNLHCSNKKWVKYIKGRFGYDKDFRQTDRIQCVKLGLPTTTAVVPSPSTESSTRPTEAPKPSTDRPTSPPASVTSGRPANDCDCSTVAAAQASPTLIGAIGGSIGLLLIVMILAIVLLMRRRRKKSQVASATSVKATEKEMPREKVLTALGERTWNWPQQENSMTGVSSAKASAENPEANKAAEPLKEAPRRDTQFIDLSSTTPTVKSEAENIEALFR